MHGETAEACEVIRTSGNRLHIIPTSSKYRLLMNGI